MSLNADVQVLVRVGRGYGSTILYAETLEHADDPSDAVANAAKVCFAKALVEIEKADDEAS